MSESYTVTERGNCRLVYGRMPVHALLSVMVGMSDDAVSDHHAARVLGATFAMGMPADLDELCRQPDVIEGAYARARALARGVSQAALDWLAMGDQGSSSAAIFEAMTGCKLELAGGHPGDPSDFGRCRKLLEQVPEFGARREELRSLSPVWEALVDNWEGLCRTMDAEAPDWRKGVGKSEQTWQLMKAIGC